MDYPWLFAGLCRATKEYFFTKGIPPLNDLRREFRRIIPYFVLSYTEQGK